MTLEKFRLMPPHKQDEYTQRPDCPVEIKVEYLDDGDCDFDRDEVTNIISAVVNQSCDFAAYCDGRRIISAASLRLSKAKCPPLTPTGKSHDKFKQIKADAAPVNKLSGRISAAERTRYD